MSDPKEPRREPAEHRELGELDLGAETVKDLEPDRHDAIAVRGGSDHPMCTIPRMVRL
ncbi:MAG: hypothetical protein ACTHMY_02015 [Solirubrobacteraceae bacterium]